MSRIILDAQQIHQDDLGEVVGSFHNTGIRQWSPEDTSQREARDLTRRIAYAKLSEGGTHEVPLS